VEQRASFPADALQARHRAVFLNDRKPLRIMAGDDSAGGNFVHHAILSIQFWGGG
jgi:hypothetical protein